MFKLICVTVIGWIAFLSPASAETVDQKIASMCAARWPEDYDMQLFCREEQTNAYNELKKQDALSAESPTKHQIWRSNKTFEAMSRTAKAITGSIKLSGNQKFAKIGSKVTLTFGNGRSVQLTSKGSFSKEWNVASPEKITAEVFQLDRDPGEIKFGNTLCGNPKTDPARYVVFHEEKDFLVVSVFGSKSTPADINSDGLCGTFNFYAR